MKENYFKLELAGSLNHAASSKPKRYYARYVRAGEVLNSKRQPSGIKIEPTALQSAAQMFENKAVFMDHAGFFDYPSLTRLAGTTQHVTL